MRVLCAEHIELLTMSDCSRIVPRRTWIDQDCVTACHQDTVELDVCGRDERNQPTGTGDRSPKLESSVSQHFFDCSWDDAVDVVEENLQLIRVVQE